MALPPAVFLLGPTASGKTRLAQELLGEPGLHFEIISVDSAQVYRGMDIGTGKSKNRVPHHLVDVRDPAEPYSAADFCQEALCLMEEITRRGCVPLLVGGTMLYFKALRDGLAKLPEADQQIREDILNLARAEGWGAVHKALQAVDPAAAARIQPGDQQRLQRALEVYRLTGQPLSELQKSNGNPCPYRLIQIGLLPEDRGLLHRRIEERLRTMLADGFVDEVRRLYERGDLHPNLPSIKSAGYRQIWSYLAGEIDQETMFQQVLAATRQLAKRQITWMRSWKVLEIIPCLPYPDRAQALKLLRSAII